MWSMWQRESGGNSVSFHPNSVGSHSPIKSFRVINKGQHNIRINTGSKMSHVEGATPPGNQSRLEKNSGRNLPLSGVFAEMYSWDHP